MTGSIFGPLIPSSGVGAAVLATAGTWMDTYLAEVERQQSMAVPTLQRPRSQQTSYDFDNWVEGQLPALVCVVPGTIGEAERHGDGSYSIWFDVQVGVLVEDTSEENARSVAELQQVALEGALLQHGSLGRFASATIFLSRQTRLPDTDNRTLAFAESRFRVLVDGVVNWQDGPATPDVPTSTPEAPYPPWPTVESTEVDFTGEPIVDE